MIELTAATLPDSPYKGFVPFLEKDAPFFFGRERETKIISANLRTQRLTLLYGPTAVGKSSVLRAGVLPTLHDLNQQLQRLYADLLTDDSLFDRINLFSGASAIKAPSDDRNLVTVVVFGEWVGDPLISLKAAIVKAIRESLPNTFNANITDPLCELPLSRMLKYITSHREVLELLIILDQFEEYFVYHSADAIGNTFAEEFSRAVAEPELRVNFLISIREDWLARLDRFKGRIPYLFDHSIRINHLDRDAADKAIRQPIEKYNKLAEALGSTQAQIIVEEDFIKEALKQLEGLENVGEVSPKNLALAKESEGGERRIHASRLQIVMQHLWEKVKNDSPPKLRLEHLPKPDTVQRIIESNIHETLDRLDQKEKLLAADFLRFLITPSGTKLADTAEDLSDRTGRPVEKMKPLLDKLSEPRFRILNTVSPPPGASNHVRYELTSDALAAPILDWLRDIRAKQHRRRSQRNYIIVFAVVAIILAIIGAWWKARQERQIANEQRRIVEEQRAKQQRAFDAWKALDDRIRNSKSVLRRHGDRVTSAVFTANGNVLTASADGTAILWDVENNDLIQEFDTKTKQMISAAISPGGDRVVTAGEDGTVISWHVGSDDKSELRAQGSNKATGISFSPDGTLIAVADATGVLSIWNSGSGEPIKQIAASSKPVTQAVFSPTGKLLAAASDDNTVHVWRTLDWGQQNSLIGHTGRINSLIFSPDEKLLATGSADTTARIWDLSTGALKDTFRGHTQSINNVDFDNDGLKLLTASDNFTARIWLLASEKPTNLIPHTDKVLSASFNPESNRVVTASGDGVVRIWSAATGQNLAELRGHIDQVTYVTYSSDGKYVLSAGDDSTARVWHAQESGNFDVAEPRIEAIPSNPIGECPITIRFVVNLTVNRGGGKIIYRFRGSDGRIWPQKEVVFDGPGTTYVNWYWKITENFTGSETIEILEPKGIKAQKAPFAVVCTGSTNAPTPTPIPPP